MWFLEIRGHRSRKNARREGVSFFLCIFWSTSKSMCRMTGSWCVQHILWLIPSTYTLTARKIFYEPLKSKCSVKICKITCWNLKFRVGFLKKILKNAFSSLLSWFVRHMTTGVGAFESPDQGGRSRYLKYIAAGHFQENQKIFPKNEGDDAHICKILTKYFMYISYQC